MFCKVFGILQLKLFNLFQAFNSWGSSKRCEQKKKKGEGCSLFSFSFSAFAPHSTIRRPGKG